MTNAALVVLRAVGRFGGDMKVVTLREGVTSDQFDLLAAEWECATDVALDVTVPKTKEFVGVLIMFLLERAQTPLALASLGELCEFAELDAALLKQVFLAGDAACRVSICMRDDLTPEIESMCITCPEADVREHFEQRRRYRRQT